MADRSLAVLSSIDRAICSIRSVLASIQGDEKYALSGSASEMKFKESLEKLEQTKSNLVFLIRTGKITDDLLTKAELLAKEHMGEKTYVSTFSQSVNSDLFRLISERCLATKVVRQINCVTRLPFNERIMSIPREFIEGEVKNNELTDYISECVYNGTLHLYPDSKDARTKEFEKELTTGKINPDRILPHLKTAMISYAKEHGMGIMRIRGIGRAYDNSLKMASIAQEEIDSTVLGNDGGTLLTMCMKYRLTGEPVEAEDYSKGGFPLLPYRVGISEYYVLIDSDETRKRMEDLIDFDVEEELIDVDKAYCPVENAVDVGLHESCSCSIA